MDTRRTSVIAGLLIAVPITVMGGTAFAHTHCGTPEAEADCPPTTTTSTTVRPTTTTVFVTVPLKPAPPLPPPAVPTPVPPPRTTVAPPATTTSVEEETTTTGAPPATRVRRTAPLATLPTTGPSDAGRNVLAGIGAALVGLVMVATTRRRTHE